MATAITRQHCVTSNTIPDDEIADRILKAIRRILKRTAEHSRHLAKEGGLSATQLLCLRLIGQTGAQQEITAVQLTDAVQLSAATVSRILDRLESQGLIQRERSRADRRKVLLQLTRSGRTCLRKLPLPLQERFLAQLGALPRRDRIELISSLETIVRMMGAEGLDVAPVLAAAIDDESNV